MAKQFKLNLYQGTHGGRRPNAGRKRIHSKGVAHTKREKINQRTPMHINFKFKCSIRNKQCLAYIKSAIQNAQTQGMRVLHFSLQSNHIHIIAEADNNVILSKGMRSLTITFAKLIGRGRVQLERYHLHVLKTLQETKNAIHYVLFNQQKHANTKASTIDEYSSILYLKNSLELIKAFAKKKKMTLTVNRPNDHFQLSNPKAYLSTYSIVRNN